MIGFSELLPKQDVKRCLEETKMAVEGIHFSISDTLDDLKTSIVSYREHMKAMEIEHLYLHGPFLDMSPVSFDSRIREATEYRFAQVYEAAIELGAEKIVFHSGYVPIFWFPDGWAERMAEFWNRFLQDRGQIPVVLENVYDPDPALLREVAELVEAPSFRLCLDMGHAHHYSKIPVNQWVELWAEKIGHVHVHDNDGTRDAHLALGGGTIPSAQVLRSVKRLAPEASCAIECNTREAVLESWRQLRGLGFE